MSDGGEGVLRLRSPVVLRDTREVRPRGRRCAGSVSVCGA